MKHMEQQKRIYDFLKTELGLPELCSRLQIKMSLEDQFIEFEELLPNSGLVVNDFIKTKRKLPDDWMDKILPFLVKELQLSNHIEVLTINMKAADLLRYTVDGVSYGYEIKGNKMHKIEVKIDNPELYEGKFGPAKHGDAGCDLRADKDYWIEAGVITKITTGVRVNMGSSQLVGIVVPRSGLGTKTGFRLANTAGIIDSGYQGEIICFISLPHGQAPSYIRRGERFAQVLFIPTATATFTLVDQFSSATERGETGFGSTGS